ncbi:hypothetical protein AB3S75_030824 [Citrus x aurantiifolia]
MTRSMLLLACALVVLASSTFASAAVVEHSFQVKNLTIGRLCRQQTITAVNGSLPGPTIRVREGDTLIVHVSNESPYNVTIHWHGIFQIRSIWADGPNMITQCPIRPGNSYTYKFRIINQEGTLWWHAHISMLRATVHGAFIIRPKSGHKYPFPKPDKEVPIVLGEWWNDDIMDVANRGEITGVGPRVSDAFTINGRPGDLYPCSENQTYKLKVEKGKTYLLRIINAALNNQLFFKIANHKFTVVAVDAGYTDPYVTDVVVIAPGQTTDVLLKADQPVGSYYMAARAYAAPPPTIVAFDNTTTRGIVVYDGASTANPIMPALPAYNDTPTAYTFYSNITGLSGGPQWVPCPRRVDERMFVTVGLGLEQCPANATCQGPGSQRLSASMNNHSFQAPTSLSILQAYFFNVGGVYEPNFPNQPPVKFDYTNTNVSNDMSLLFPPKTTSVKMLKFNSTVEMVLQNTALVAVESHPMHLHGYDFYVLAQGFGNYNASRDSKNFNFVNPQRRNTIAVPIGGWAVIRFRANNPGVWFMHCHFDAHLPWGLATTFIVENGPTPSTMLPPPPADLPRC